MGINKEIDGISDVHANTIYARFCKKQTPEPTATQKRTLAREYLRSKKLSPRQAVAQPLPTRDKRIF